MLSRHLLTIIPRVLRARAVHQILRWNNPAASPVNPASARAESMLHAPPIPGEQLERRAKQKAKKPWSVYGPVLVHHFHHYQLSQVFILALKMRALSVHCYGQKKHQEAKNKLPTLPHRCVISPNCARIQIPNKACECRTPRRTGKHVRDVRRADKNPLRVCGPRVGKFLCANWAVWNAQRHRTSRCTEQADSARRVKRAKIDTPLNSVTVTSRAPSLSRNWAAVLRRKMLSRISSSLLHLP